MIDFWLGEMSAFKDSVIIVKPHPAISHDDVEYMRRYGYEVSDLSTAVLVTACDLYLSSTSSTIRWGLANGKPVMNYDMYRYHYSDYASEEAVVTVWTKEEFRNEVARWANDESYLGKLTRAAYHAAGHWGMLDGRSMDRIRSLFDELAVRPD
jgi:CDP-glycerol glycerophosphotransferase (TagB/SpsB family)